MSARRWSYDFVTACRARDGDLDERLEVLELTFVEGVDERCQREGTIREVRQLELRAICEPFVGKHAEYSRS